ncbi:MAG: ArsC family reductase [Alphaproteobacteria bacterium]
MSITLYGISNCDTVRRARKWLDAEGIDAAYHDFRKDGLAEAQLKKWVGAVGIDTLLNKRGTTWRNLPDDQKDGLSDIDAIALMVEHPALIKRPVIEAGNKILVGFKAAQQDALKAAK